MKSITLTLAAFLALTTVAHAEYGSENTSTEVKVDAPAGEDVNVEIKPAGEDVNVEIKPDAGSAGGDVSVEVKPEHAPSKE